MTFQKGEKVFIKCVTKKECELYHNFFTLLEKLELFTFDICEDTRLVNKDGILKRNYSYNRSRRRGLTWLKIKVKDFESP
jgi:hypothetical protein